MKSFQLEINFTSGNKLLCDKANLEESAKELLAQNPGRLNEEEAKARVLFESNNFIELLKKLKKLEHLTVTAGACEVVLNPDKIDYIKIIKEQ